MTDDPSWYEQRTTQARENSRPTSDFVRIALAGDEDAAGQAIGFLHWRATREVFDEAVRPLTSANSNERIVGADILGQLGLPHREFLEKSLDILLPMLTTETDPSVLQAVAIALGHICDPKAIGPLVKLKRHTDRDVRYGVVHGLLTYEDERAIYALIELSHDTDENVRDWATFGLAQQIDTDTPEIREALLQRLSDEHNATRAEAMMGLAMRQDTRVLAPMIKELTFDDTVGLLVLEAAAVMKHPSLCPALLKLEHLWTDDADAHMNILMEAIQECGCETQLGSNGNKGAPCH